MTQIAGVRPSQTQPFQLDCDRIIQLTQSMVCVVGSNGYFEYLNSHWENLLGYSTAKLIAAPLQTFIHADDRIPTLNIIKTLFDSSPTTPTSLHFESRWYCQQGGYKWLAWHASFQAEQKVIYAVVRDITEHKQTQQALKDSEERFRCLVENVKDYAIYMLDPEGKVVSWNRGAERINGYTAEEIIGQPVSAFYPPEDIRIGKPTYELQIAASVGRFEDESRRVRRDGSQFWAHTVVTALHDKQGQLRGFAKVTRDITERKHAEAALQQAYDDLEHRVQERTAELMDTNRLLQYEVVERKQAEAGLRQSEAQLRQQTHQLQQTLQRLQETQAKLVQSEKMSSLGQLVAGVAHEINNPVNFISGNIIYASQYVQDLLAVLALYQTACPHPSPDIAEALADYDIAFVQADLPKLLNSMKVGADRIRQIVLSLRNFSRLDEAEKKPVDIHEGLDNTLMILQHRLKARPGFRDVTIHKDYADLPLVDCYAGQLNQVFMNILSNAIDALEEKAQTTELSRADDSCQTPSTAQQAEGDRPPAFQPTITLQTTQRDRNWIVIRIADNGLGITDRVKQRLFDPFFTTKPVGKGTGLGLSISYQIVVEQHGGQLKCQSNPNQGTEFVIEIPLHTTAPTQSLRAS